MFSFGKRLLLASLFISQSTSIKMSSLVSKSSMKVGLCQIKVTADKALNIENAQRAIQSCSEADLIVR
jgi:hypothetical protein